MGVYADIGDRLIERGFAAIPIIPGTKKPGFLHAGAWVGLSNWQKRFNRGVPSEDIRASVGDQRQTGLIADTVESTRMTIAESNLAPVDLIKRSRTFRGSVRGSAPVPQIGRPCGYA